MPDIPDMVPDLPHEHQMYGRTLSCCGHPLLQKYPSSYSSLCLSIPSLMYVHAVLDHLCYEQNIKHLLTMCMTDSETFCLVMLTACTH